MTSHFSFFFNDTATTEIYTLSLHDALPIYGPAALARIRDPALEMLQVLPVRGEGIRRELEQPRAHDRAVVPQDRKSTRLNSSHVEISYAVFCLKKKKKKKKKQDNRIYAT